MGENSSLLTGGIRTNILKFAFPIFLGSLFQQFYNMADALIVGNYAGDTALAAVTSTGSIIFLFMGFFGGLYQGMGIVIARYFGAGEVNIVNRSIGTAVLFSIFSGIFLILVGTLLTSTIVDLVGTPASVYEDSVNYLRVFFMGSLFTAVYNAICGIFRALGDSKRPLYYLIAASLTNIVLDIIFVGYMGMGVVGAGLATVIAQGLSAGLAISKLLRMKGLYTFSFRNLCWDTMLLKKMINIGLPSGVQNSVIAFANVIVQSNINSFGPVAMAGTGAYNKLQGFIFLPIEAFSMATTTFVSQNIGARNYKRILRGSSFGLRFSCTSAQILGILAIIFATDLIGIFGGGLESVRIGTQKIYIDALFYACLAYSHTVSSILRGAGRAKTPMLIMLGIWCVLRVTYIQIATTLTDDIVYVFYAYPMTWILSAVLFWVSYKKLRKKFTQELENDENEK